MTGFEIQRFGEGEAVEAPAEVESAEVAVEAEGKPEAAQVDIQAEVAAAVAKAVKQLDAEYRKREAAAYSRKARRIF